MPSAYLLSKGNDLTFSPTPPGQHFELLLHSKKVVFCYINKNKFCIFVWG